MEFTDFISKMSDCRRGQGQRYSFESMMWMVFLSIACGYESSRKMATFCASYKQVFIDYFGLKHGTPSYGTFHTFLSDLDSSSFAQSFNSTMVCYSELEQGDWIAGDGQTLCSTVSSCHTKEQDYVSVVSLFCQKTGLSILLKDYMNKDKQESEAKIVLELLLNNLKDKGLMFTLDALHCQKKTLKNIVASGNEFTVQVKGNTPKLLASLETTIASSTHKDTHIIEQKKMV